MNSDSEPEWLTECIRMICELFNENSARHFMDRSSEVCAFYSLNNEVVGR
uniref:GNAT family N-acetyltransferase n=1 Tax=Ascaris lumbricoides TaxID=6252 RepID=A0A0M3HGP0_ASCLU